MVSQGFGDDRGSGPVFSVRVTCSIESSPRHQRAERTIATFLYGQRLKGGPEEWWTATPRDQRLGWWELHDVDLGVTSYRGARREGRPPPLSDSTHGGELIPPADNRNLLAQRSWKRPNDRCELVEAVAVFKVACPVCKLDFRRDRSIVEPILETLRRADHGSIPLAFLASNF